MPLNLAALLPLLPVCAPAVSSSTMAAVAQVESGLNPLAIGVNGPRPAHLSFADPASAAHAARVLIAQGRNVDLGLGQINVRNLAHLKLSVEDAFDPCRNLAASAAVLQAAYARATPAPGEELASLKTALSYYNTGRSDRGFANGYVAKVTAAARAAAPDIAGMPSPTPTPRTASQPAAWDVFGGDRPTVKSGFVFTPSSGVEP